MTPPLTLNPKCRLVKHKVKIHILIIFALWIKFILVIFFIETIFVTRTSKDYPREFLKLNLFKNDTLKTWFELLAFVLLPISKPSTKPAAIATTFFNVPHSSTPSTSRTYFNSSGIVTDKTLYEDFSHFIHSFLPVWP